MQELRNYLYRKVKWIGIDYWAINKQSRRLALITCKQTALGYMLGPLIRIIARSMLRYEIRRFVSATVARTPIITSTAWKRVK